MLDVLLFVCACFFFFFFFFFFSFVCSCVCACLFEGIGLFAWCDCLVLVSMRECVFGAVCRLVLGYAGVLVLF